MSIRRTSVAVLSWLATLLLLDLAVVLVEKGLKNDVGKFLVSVLGIAFAITYFGVFGAIWLSQDSDQAHRPDDESDGGQDSSILADASHLILGGLLALAVGFVVVVWFHMLIGGKL